MAQCIRIGIDLTLLVPNGVVVGPQCECPPLDPTRGHGWYSSGLIEYVREWFVVSFYLISSPVERLVVLLHPEYNG